MRLLWLSAVIRAAGLTVVEEPGWTMRGVEFTQPIRWIACHHTATSAKATGDYPSMRIVRDGRLPPDPSPVPGPLSQLGLGRSGTVYIIASGRANHAGLGAWPGLSGGSDSIGIEAEHPGGSAPWNPDMYDAYVALVAALAEHIGDPVILGHKEWAPTRKTDPTFNMADFRLDVAEQQEDDVALTADQLRAVDFARLLRLSALKVGSGHTFPEYMIPVIRDEDERNAALDARIKALDARLVAFDKRLILAEKSGGGSIDVTALRADLEEVKADLRAAGT